MLSKYVGAVSKKVVFHILVKTHEINTVTVRTRKLGFYQTIFDVGEITRLGVS